MDAQPSARAVPVEILLTPRSGCGRRTLADHGLPGFGVNRRSSRSSMKGRGAHSCQRNRCRFRASWPSTAQPEREPWRQDRMGVRSSWPIQISEFGLKKEIGARDQSRKRMQRPARSACSGFKIVLALVGVSMCAKAHADGEVGKRGCAFFLPAVPYRKSGTEEGAFGMASLSPRRHPRVDWRIFVWNRNKRGRVGERGSPGIAAIAATGKEDDRMIGKSDDGEPAELLARERAGRILES